MRASWPHPSLAERVTIALGELTWRFSDVTVVAHRTLQMVDLFVDDEHVATAPVAATMIEWKAQEHSAGFRRPAEAGSEQGGRLPSADARPDAGGGEPLARGGPAGEP